MTVAADPEVLPYVRQAVRGMLERAPLYLQADPAQRRQLAERLVGVSALAAKLLAEDRRLTAQVARRSERHPPRRTPAALATAQAAGSQLDMKAIGAAPGALTSMRDAIDFPTYVQSLITGVFQAILSSSTQQVGALGELLDNVSATAEEFDSSIGDAEVTRWALGKFPSLLTATEDGALLPVPGVDLLEHTAQLKGGLSASEAEVAGIDESDLDGTLMPLVRRKMGRDKQSVLASMVQMGLQRIVVDEGRIHASMDLRVDAQSGSQQDVAQRNDWRVSAGAAGSFGVGPWSASASASTSIGQVKSDHQYTNEQIGVRAGLRSTVDLAFRTEQVPLDRLVDAKARVKIDNNARVPTDVSGSQSILPAAAAPANFGPLPMDNIPAPPNLPPPALVGKDAEGPKKKDPAPKEGETATVRDKNGNKDAESPKQKDPAPKEGEAATVGDKNGNKDGNKDAEVPKKKDPAPK